MAIRYTGYRRFDGDAMMDDIGEMGLPKRTDHGAARKRLRAAASSEVALKVSRSYGGNAYVPPASDAPNAHPHFGFVLASCERADLRPTPTGVWIYEDEQRMFEPVPVDPVLRVEVIDELVRAVVDGITPRHDGAWGCATLEATIAILDAAQSGGPVTLHRQVAVRD